MLVLALSLGLIAVTGYVLRGGFAGAGWNRVGFDVNALGLSAVAIAAAIWFFGWQYGLAFIIAIMLHEIGHVAAFRVCGHKDAQFRLIPLFGGVAVSRSLPASHDKDLFISLMGPAICLGPMALCFATAELLPPSAYAITNFLYIQGLVLGGLNLFNLLPFWPLDGGKITRLLTYTFFPKATRAVSIIMSATAAALCVLTHSYFLLLFVLIGWQGLIQSEKLIEIQRPMRKSTALLALAAYLTTAAALFTGAAQFVQSLL
ncbi:site-2 protease family protein [Cypionkella sp.]|uniref:site-2 protease family protein n=1 Tax=Cypionkella sp. TaxID=2811411 RepID=UPI002611FFD6|nr:site-2 protease family protein [Cypionkella sp.]MDB5666742.1 Metalloprotease [Cypionkella sp.]